MTREAGSLIKEKLTLKPSFFLKKSSIIQWN